MIPYGLERTRYRLSGVTGTRVQAIRANVTSPIVLFVGRLVPYKGVDVLLKAVKGLDALTVIVGDGPCRMSLMALGHRLRPWRSRSVHGRCLRRRSPRLVPRL